MRQKVALKYDNLPSRLPLPPTLPIEGTKIDLDNLASSLPDLPIDLPKTLEEAKLLGRRLLEATGEKPKSTKGKGKEKEVTAEIVAEQMTKLGLDTAQFRLLSHRASEFTRLATSYVSERVSQSHAVLSADSKRGLRTTAELEDGGIGKVFGGVESAGGAGLDPRDLLRGIARADGKRGGR
ncbi:hypothetical protein P7C70_g9245, partial [Phenoliferia sp. Uapishka_3]